MIDVEAVAMGKKVYLTFLCGEPVQKFEGTGMGAVDEVWIIKNRSLIHYWRFKRDYRKS